MILKWILFGKNSRLKKMETREVLPAECDTLEQLLEKALPSSICAFVHFKLMRTRKLLVEKKILVNCWPEPSVLVIVDSKDRGILPTAIIFCKGPEYARCLETLLQVASRNVSPPISVVGCSPDVLESLVNLYESSEACPFKWDHTRITNVYTFPQENIVPLIIPNGFKICELSERHIGPVKKSWPYSEEFEKYSSMERWLQYHFSNFPTVCVETEDGLPVAWELQQNYGAVGMLHVAPEYRRKKLGSIVTRALAEKMTREGQMVFACTVENNETAEAFHEKNGYKCLPLKICFLEYLF